VKTVLVAGGAGGVGGGIVAELLRRGHRAIVPSRSAAKLGLLRERLAAAAVDASPLQTFVGAVGEYAGACAVRDRIVSEHGTIDAVVASLGGWWEGRLLEMTPEEWDAVIHEMLGTHFIFARVFVPMLAAQGGGLYLGIGGGAAYFPVPRSAPVSIAAAAQLMLTRALCEEVADTAVQILELVVDGPIRTRLSEHIAQAGWIENERVATIAAELIERGKTDDPAAKTSGAIVRMR
jgi:NAD(P)-dependent dehydrogenase (short-subunit alcohol dehydrogenase family)